MLERRDAARRLGLVWEREQIAPEAAFNEDFVALTLDPALSTAPGEDGAWRNMIIEGDNWDALRALRLTHGKRIKCILVDPPYNTGNADFVYNDRFVGREDQWRQSTWLEFLYRRFLLARDLLADDGVILVCINDENRAILELMLDQVFPRMRVGSFVWKTRIGSNDAKGAFLSVDHEHVLAFANPGFRFGGQAKTFAMYDNPDADPNGPWRSSDLTGPSDYISRPRLFYPLRDPNTGFTYCANPSRRWIFPSKENEEYLATQAAARNEAFRRTRKAEWIENWIAKGRIIFPTNPRTTVWKTLAELKAAIASGDVPRGGSGAPLLREDLPEAYLQRLVGRTIAWGVPAFKRYRSELKNQTQPLSTWVRPASEPAGPDAEGAEPDAVELVSAFNDEGAKSVQAAFQSKAFSFAKPPSLFKALLSQSLEPGDIVLDFFAGAGTTALAVLALNEQDDGNRGFILVSSTEATAADPEKNLCRDICAGRVRRVIEGVGVPEPLPGDFAYLRAERLDWDDVVYDLTPAAIWTAIQLRHARPLRPFDGAAPVQLSPAPEGSGEPLLLYTPEWNEAAEAAVRAAAAGTLAIVFSPVPGPVRDALPLPNISVEAVPGFMLDEFPQKVAGL